MTCLNPLSKFLRLANRLIIYALATSISINSIGNAQSSPLEAESVNVLWNKHKQLLDERQFWNDLLVQINSVGKLYGNINSQQEQLKSRADSLNEKESQVLAANITAAHEIKKTLIQKNEQVYLKYALNPQERMKTDIETNGTDIFLRKLTFFMLNGFPIDKDLKEKLRTPLTPNVVSLNDNRYKLIRIDSRFQQIINVKEYFERENKMKKDMSELQRTLDDLKSKKLQYSDQEFRFKVLSQIFIYSSTIAAAIYAVPYLAGTVLFGSALEAIKFVADQSPNSDSLTIIFLSPIVVLMTAAFTIKNVALAPIQIYKFSNFLATKFYSGVSKKEIADLERACLEAKWKLEDASGNFKDRISGNSGYDFGQRLMSEIDKIILTGNIADLPVLKTP